MHKGKGKKAYRFSWSSGNFMTQNGHTAIEEVSVIPDIFRAKNNKATEDENDHSFDFQQYHVKMQSAIYLFPLQNMALPLLVLYALSAQLCCSHDLFASHPADSRFLSRPRGLSTKEKLDRLQAAKGSDSKNKPNFIIFFADDMGYGDVSYNGHPTISTPNIDYYALSGIRLTTWYSGFHVCSPSRAAMLTGRLCVRSGTCGGWTGSVFREGAIGGLPTNETTFASVLRHAGYRTKAIGKWHLGVLPEYMPLGHGFDEYLGIPYSVDMGCSVWNPRCFTKNGTHVPGLSVLPLIKDNGTVVEQPADLSKLTQVYYEAATDFIHRSVEEEQPFVLYFAHNHVHVPDYMSPTNCNQSARGFFGAAVEELDQLIGDVMAFVRSKKIEQDTLVFFTSDNGPWMTQKLAGGSAALFRGAKQNTWEGGVREPAWAYWPGMIDAGSRSMEITATYDIFTTMITMVGATQYLPNDDRVYDGKDMSDILFNLNGGRSEHDCIYYWGGTPNDTSCNYWNSTSNHALCYGLFAVRCGEFKAHWITRDQNGSHSLQDPPLLFNLNHDPSELHPIWPNNVGYDGIMQRLTAAKWEHQDTIKPVVNQVERGFTTDNWFCGDPNSKEKYPQYPRCTTTTKNWNAFVCNPVCLDFDNCGPSVLHQ